MSRGRRTGHFALICLLPTLAALWSVTVSIGSGTLVPWSPRTEDLNVYREAARALVEGRDFYQLEGVFPYIYPPIAAVLALPLLVVPWTIAQLVWTVANAVVVVLVLRHLRVRPGWLVSIAAAAAILFLTPFTITLGMGQLGILLMALVLLDATDGPRLRAGRKPLLPPGVLTGIATGLKLTPAVFIVHYFLTKRYRQGIVASVTFLGTVLIGLAVAPGPSWGYWMRLAGGDSGANPDAYGWLANISVLSAVYRFTDVTSVGTVVGLGLSAVFVVLGLVAAVVARKHGHDVLGVALLGMVSSLANPIAWVHHLTWVLPLAVVGLRDRLPDVLRWAVLITALWGTVQPQFALKGAPWAHAEIHEYSVAEKVFAAGTDIVVLLTVLLVWVGMTRGRVRAPARRTAGEPTDGDSKA
ncbi:glycosyltransferase 87 family protein [Ammonicoccus fulvus]|uniref:Glycosyltransferase 87 family protein n=1 Tax=Ammonicoccus fulvus TaxID=3138240 RepID=A0ABZ3FR62_9ACTN